MKTLIITLATVFFGVLSFVLGTFLYPFLGWMTGLPIDTFPRYVTIALALAMVLHLVIASIMKKGKLWCLLWIPLLVCQSIFYFYIDRKFGYYKGSYKYHYKDGEYIITDEAITNKFGLYILKFRDWFPPDSIDIIGEFVLCKSRDFNFEPSYYALYSLEDKCALLSGHGLYIEMQIIDQRFLLCKTKDDKLALYSLEDKRMVLPPEENYKRIDIKSQGKLAYCFTHDKKYALYSLEEKRMIIPPFILLDDYLNIETKNGKYGIVTLYGDVLVPFVYDHIYFNVSFNSYTAKRREYYYDFDDYTYDVFFPWNIAKLYYTP